MGKHFDLDGDGVADQGTPSPVGQPDSGDYDLGVPYVRGQYFHRLQQAPGLGRHVLHDRRSKAYDAVTLVKHVTTERTTYHRRIEPIWDQGDVGACTAFAALGLMATEPYYRPSWRLDAQRALQFYELETRMDDRQIPGQYPAEDTGSTGLWSMKALVRLGYVKSYRHAFSLATVKKLLQLSPVSIGIPWYNSMFQPDRDGFITLLQSSGLAGGHQIVGAGVDFERQAVKIDNSWGEGWGLKGSAYIRFGDLDRLLKVHGDVSVPTEVSSV